MKYCLCFRFLMGRRFTRLKRLCGNIGKNAICTYGKFVKIKKIKTGLNILCIISAKKVWLKILEKIMECLLNSLLRAKSFFTNCGREKRKEKSLPESKYPIQEKDELKIIIFDIPEAEKRKRAWLRSVLRNLEFTMIQKSVWSGKTKLPQEFISQMHKLNLLSYVEIFTISKTGSLKKLKT